MLLLILSRAGNNVWSSVMTKRFSKLVWSSTQFFISRPVIRGVFYWAEHEPVAICVIYTGDPIYSDWDEYYTGGDDLELFENYMTR